LRLVGWTSVYTANPVLPAACPRALARQVGAHIYNDRDDTLYASRSFLTVAADAAGWRIMHLPRRLDILDPFTDTVLWNAVTRFAYNFQAKETVIWRLG